MTPEPATATELAARAGLQGRELTMHATRVLMRLEADALAVRTGTEQVPRWRLVAIAPGTPRSDGDSKA